MSETGRSRRVVLALPQFAAVALAVARSDLIAALPEQFARAYADTTGLAVYALPMPTGVPEISMYWHSRHDENPAHRWLRDHVRAVAAAF